ncbi:hydroxyacid dehydrogenase [Catenulispora subtropica]|uniref:Hydroxyacid dehydrogenase n=1 Tax=Catenulispora subtropica TaxID=450798 RepID=A0ABN2QGJ8_9ACTN
MAGRVAAVLAMRPDVADAAFPAASRARLDALVALDPGPVLTDFGTPRAREALAGAEVLLTGWGCPVLDAGVLDTAPRLRAVIHAAGSVKHHLGPDFWARGILASSAADANAYPVAQFTLSVILLSGKRTFEMARHYAEGGFKDAATSPRFGNAGRTVGVIGASRIGRLVVPMLAREGFRVLVSDPTLTAADAAALVPAPWSVEVVGLDELLRRSDVVTVHAPSLPETHHLLDDARLALMRDGSVLVNTARGALVDTDALARHCAAGRIDAFLDVTDPEPLPPGHPLFLLPNVVVTPHLAGAMGSEVAGLGDFAIGEVERYVRGLPLRGAVREDDLARIA